MFEIGNTLREARLRRRLDISDCESATKIRSKYLRALEEEQFEVLPGGTYVKSFLRTYAEYLELDGRLVLDEFESRFESPVESPSDEASTARARARRRRRRTSEVRMLLGATGLVLMLSLAVWVGFADDPPRTAPPAPPADAINAVFRATGTRPLYIEARERGPEGRSLFAPVSLARGQSKAITAVPPVWVRVGDGAGLRLTIDGTRVRTAAGRQSFLILAGGTLQASVGS